MKCSRLISLLFVAATVPNVADTKEVEAPELHRLRLAVQDLRVEFGEDYPRAGEFLRQIRLLEELSTVPRGTFEELKRKALLANPLLSDLRVLLVKRAVDPRAKAEAFGFPSNHECNSSLDKTGHNNEIIQLHLPATGEQPQRVERLYQPPDGGYVGELELHWDRERLLFAQSDSANWKIWELKMQTGGVRQVSRAPEDVDCFDPCYLPDGRIVFGSTASYQSVPCWHGQRLVANLYVMNPDGSGMRRLCYDQDHNFHPSMLANGQVIYHRWDYTGINHIFMRQLMVMNPDGTGQRAIYGSNSWYPNALYFPRELPGAPGRLIAVLSGYHGVHRMGQLVLLDTRKGWHEEKGLIRRISGKDEPIRPRVKDRLVDADWPKFLHPFPLNRNYFLVACQPDKESPCGLYLADAFDNLLLIREEPGFALLEPIPLRERKSPRVIPDRVNLQAKEGTVYLQDVYTGPGLAGVPTDTIKGLRVLAYHFGYPGLAGPDKIGRGGPWEVMRILGTVPVEHDGSAYFQVPANTPIAVQPLDAEGKAVQLMRSWFTVMPGETISCVGCHETPANAPPNKKSFALQSSPAPIEPWHGPARGFDFAREVQPVLNRHCVHCHAGGEVSPDLRGEECFPEYQGLPLSELGRRRLHPRMLRDTAGFARYTPAYEALLPYIRRVGIEDDVSLLSPGEYHADTSELIQLLQKGHQGVVLDEESWDRLITWIDLNAPCHGTWHEVYPVPDGAHDRRLELATLHGGPPTDPEIVPEIPPRCRESSSSHPSPPPSGLSSPLPLENRSSHNREIQGRQSNRTLSPIKVDLGEGVTMRLVPIPAGEFVMGDPAGHRDERPLSVERLARPFWIGLGEVNNRQFRRFDPTHDSGYYTKRHARSDDRGLSLDDARQPAVRVSWLQAMAFCQWLSEKTGLHFSLPTEIQWEYACRAGTQTPLSYGGVQDDFGAWGNMADQSFSAGLLQHGKQITGGLEHLVLEGAALAVTGVDDGAVVTMATGHYRPNAWGVHDMHGNAAEWTRSDYAVVLPAALAHAKPARFVGATSPRQSKPVLSRKIVRGGSFFDRPERCRSAFRLGYAPWQKVFNVGFRVVCEKDEP